MSRFLENYCIQIFSQVLKVTCLVEMWFMTFCKLFLFFFLPPTLWKEGFFFFFVIFIASFWMKNLFTNEAIVLCIYIWSFFYEKFFICLFKRCFFFCANVLFLKHCSVHVYHHLFLNDHSLIIVELLKAL